MDLNSPERGVGENDSFLFFFRVAREVEKVFRGGNKYLPARPRRNNKKEAPTKRRERTMHKLIRRELKVLRGVTRHPWEPRKKETEM